VAALALDPIPASKAQSDSHPICRWDEKVGPARSELRSESGTATTMKKTKHDHLLISDYENELLTIGLDLGDRTSHYCVLNSKGEISIEGALQCNPAALHKYFAGIRRCP
jgi:hypothetical protein